MALPEDFLERLRQSNDIVAAFSGHVQLKRAGRDYVCLCPFHSEKSASCHIYVDSQSFYCFGCGAGGSVITFTQLIENLDYMSAVRQIAERSGIAMPDDSGGKAELDKRKRIFEMNKAAAKFFVDCLKYNSGENNGISHGLQFLRGRGLSDNTIRKYGLGFAPNSWNMLKFHLNGLGYSDNELVEAALLRRSEQGKVYDFFRNRVMFPVIDRSGNVIAFSGRKVDDSDEYGGKYVNSSETAVYKKGETVFSLNFAKNSKLKYMILCEGNIDAVMLNQAGFDNAVAILGTALTHAQARLLRFYCAEVILAYDSDAAGEKATVKTGNIFNKEGLSVRILEIDGNDAKDPDEYIKKFGADSFAQLVEKAVSWIEFELKRRKKPLDMDSQQGRSEYLKKAVDFLSEVDNDLDRLVHVSTVADECGVTKSGVEDAIEKKRRSRRYSQAKEEKRELLRTYVPAKQGSFGDGVKAGVNVLSPLEKAESGVIAFLFHSPDKLPLILRSLTPEDFPGDFNRKLFETLILRLNKRQLIDITSLGGEFSPQEMGRIKRIEMENAVLPFTDLRLNEYISVLLEHRNSVDKKSPADMSNEELLEYTREIRNKKAAISSV
ncbi:MAG: DNA primase [Oscillospiraceae bacterium]|nr:DNA primase [Oscillospiraceae bacterium]